MGRRIPKGAFSERSASARRRREFFRLGLERLEDRTMLDAGVAASTTLPASIVVGRTLSAYDVPDVQNNQETITYTVYNEQADPVTGVLLTTTLQPGVTFAGASQQPDRSGQDLAWSLGRIGGFGRASVSLTVSLATPTPTQLDGGARAFGTLDGGAVAAGTPAASLRATAIPAALLASTPDANITDPFVQEEAAKLSYDPQQIFNFLHTQVGYNAYAGSVRGARGTLWSGAGNSLDVASLGVALMRASGIPAQYAQGSLPFNLSQQMILSMFPAQDHVLGYIPSGTSTSDPAGNGQLLGQTENHTWFQFDAGGGMLDADPLVAGAAIGKSFATATTTFSEVPDAQREKVEVQLNAEMYNQAATLFGLSGLSTTTVLDHTFNDVDLVGHPLAIGNFASGSGIGAIISATTFTYSPYIQVGDYANPDTNGDQVIDGTPFQEVFTNFPVGTQILTGLFLKVTLSGPQGGSETDTHTIFDRIGPAARLGQAAVSVSADPSGNPSLSNFDITSLNVLPGLTSPHVLAPLAAQLQAVESQRAALQAQLQAAGGSPSEALLQQASTLFKQYITLLQRSLGASYAAASDASADQLATTMFAAAYAARPRLAIVSAHVAQEGTSATLNLGMDLLRDTLFVVAAPGQSTATPFAFAVAQGINDSSTEGNVLASVTEAGVAAVLSAAAIIQAAQDQGIGILVLTSQNASLLDTLAISANAKALISQALANNEAVLVPSQSPTVNGQAAIAWYQTNLTTGETIGVLEDGSHGAEDTGLRVAFANLERRLTSYYGGYLAGWLAGTIVSVAGQVALLTSLATGNWAQTTLIPIPIPGAGILINFLIGKGLEALLPFLPVGADFAVGLIQGYLLATGALKKTFLGDPSASGMLLNAAVPVVTTENLQSVAVAESATTTAGAVGAGVQAASVAVAGGLSASWGSSATSGFLASSLAAGAATVTGPGGAVIGSGSVALSSASPVSVAISGAVQYNVSGSGSLSFYGAAGGSSLGAAGEWSSYTATVAGGVTITLTTSGLTLNGQALPAGTYTITTTTATIAGSGPSTSPDFAGAATIDAAGAVVVLGAGSGNVAVGGKPLDPGGGETLAGYFGSMTVSAGAGGTDAVMLAGSASAVLSVSAGPSLTTDQNTPVTFQANVQTSLAGTYTLTAEAPAGWTVTIDAGGKVTATPAPGLQGGTYPIQVVARSSAAPGLVAQATVDVTITPTQAGVTLGVAADPAFTVPFNGADVPTAFRATIRNTGPAADTFNLTTANVPSGFTIVKSAASVTIPAGGTAEVGLYLVPTGSLPAPGTPLSFSVTATSATAATITQTQTVSFAMPAVDAVTLTSTPGALSSTPGAPATATITLSNVGNVPETVSLSSATAAGLTASALAPVSLAAGQSTTVTVTLTPDASAPLNSILDETVTATFGPSAAPVSQTLIIPVLVAAPGVAAINAASIAATQLNINGLAGRLNDLGVALTNLVQAPTSAVFQGQAVANLDSLVSLLTGDPFLSSFTAGLASARAALASAATASDVQAAVTNLGAALTTLAGVLTDDAQHGFTLSLSQDRLIAQPNQAETFNILLKNTGSVATTYDLTISGLPAGVTASFSRASVTLQPGAQVTASNNPITLSLTETGAALIPVSFTVTATAEGAVEITRGTPGQLRLRDEALLVAAVTTNPPYTPSGGQVQVAARVQSVVNQPETVNISYVVEDPSGKTIFTSSPTSLSLDAATSLTTANLGTFDTTGLADGIYTVVASLADSSGRPIPSGVGQGYLVIGLPVTATVTTTPTTVPTGSDTVTTTVQVHGQMAFPSPLTLLGQVATGDNELSTVLYTNNLAYEVGNNGISIVDVSDPANPKVLGTFAQDVVVKGGANIAKVVGHDLLVASTTTLNASGFTFLVYDLTDPLNPALVSNTNLPYRFFAGMFVLGDVALFPLQEYDFFPAGANTTYFAQSGNVLSVDISDLAHPKVLGELFPSNDPHVENGAVIVNSQVAYTLSSTNTGGDTSSGVGNLLLLDISDPAKPKVTGNLNIPNTNILSNIIIRGNRALVVGSSGGLLQPFNFGKTAGLTGNVTLTELDISDPANPKVLGSTLVTEATSTLDATLPPGQRDLVDLGNGLFALSNVLENGNPAILLIDANDPDNIIVGAVQTPALYNGLTVSGSTLYVGTPTGLATYDIGQLVSSPVAVSVQVPADSANLALQAGSFNKPPTQIIHGAGSDTYVWDRSLAFGNTDLSFSWQTKVSNLAAGDTAAVTLGTAVALVNQGTSGSVSLAGTAVTAVPIISVTPASQTAQPGGTATYDVRLENPTGAQVTYNLNVTGAPGSVNVPFSVTVAANGTVDVPLTITPYAFASPGDNTFTVTAEYVQFTSNFQGRIADFKGSATAVLTVAGAPALQPDAVAHGVVVALAPAQGVAGQGGAAHYVVRLTNTGSADDFYSLQVTGLPDGVFAQFSSSFVRVPAGASNFREVTLTLTNGQGTSPGVIPFQVVATAQSKTTVTGSAAGTLTVTSGGVSVSLSPGSGAPGAGFQVVVTNTGTVADTYTLALGGPAAAGAALGTTQITLAPGASQMVPIATGAVNFAVPGGLQLVAMATSQSDASIRGADTASLTVPTTQGLSAQFQTPVQVLSAPGTATFLLMVNNTGNGSDTYTATIVGSNGPIAASLVGLDGLPTQTIPTFVLPGLSSAAILLRANLSALGQGAVTVQVQSQGNPALVASATATLSAQAETGPTPTPTPSPTPTPTPTPTPAPTPGVVDGPVVTRFLRYGYHQAPTTLVLTFNEPLDPARAQDPNNYRIIGPDGRMIRVVSASYDPATLTVSLSPQQRLDVHAKYLLIVIGTGPGGVSDPSGVLLDGARTGQPGSNFVTTVTLSNVVLGAHAPSHPPAITRLAGLRRAAVVPPHRPASAAAKKVSIPRTNGVHQVHPNALAVDHSLASGHRLGRHVLRGIR
jgi:uncharacterized membrane protein